MKITKRKSEIENISVENLSELDMAIKLNFNGGQHQPCDIEINEEISLSEEDLYDHLADLEGKNGYYLSSCQFELGRVLDLKKSNGKSTFTLNFLDD
jgi:hypothetical protein